MKQVIIVELLWESHSFHQKIAKIDCSGANNTKNGRIEQLQWRKWSGVINFGFLYGRIRVWRLPKEKKWRWLCCVVRGVIVWVVFHGAFSQSWRNTNTHLYRFWRGNCWVWISARQCFSSYTQADNDILWYVEYKLDEMARSAPDLIPLNIYEMGLNDELENRTRH